MNHIIWHPSSVTKAQRSAQKQQQPFVLWLTGLSGSGKSSLANALEIHLSQQGKHTYLLDADNIRLGLNKDLGFDHADRAENIRRIAEVAKLMVDSGLIVITAFISPFKADREMVRNMFEPNEFFEIFLDTPLEVCESRDPKGLYKKARHGLIQNFTGLDSPYEKPDSADLVIKAHNQSIDASVLTVVQHISKYLSTY